MVQTLLLPLPRWDKLRRLLLFVMVLLRLGVLALVEFGAIDWELVKSAGALFCGELGVVPMPWIADRIVGRKADARPS